VQFFIEAGWLDLISGYLIKSSLILAMALVLVFLLRKRSAGLRHLVLSLFLIGLLFLPVLSSLTAGWETGLLPTWETGASGSVDGSLVKAQHLHLGFSTEGLAVSEDLPDSRGYEKTSRPFQSRLLSEMRSVIGPGALIVWLLGSAYLIFRLALGLLGAVRLTREGSGMEDSLWKRLLHRFLTAVSLRRKVHLLRHDRVRIPLTWGFLKPVVMMPSVSEGWSESQCSTALYHELAHVKRGDFLIMLLARMSRALYWFNPLSWVVFRMIRKEQEKACDELVLKAGIKPSTYAENLLLIRNSVPLHWNPPAAVLGALGRSQLNDRLIAILKQKLNFEEVKMKTKIMLGVLVILSISFIGMARPVGLEAGTAEVMVADSTVIQPPAVFAGADVSPQDQEKQEQEKKEKKKEEQKAKEEKEKAAMVWTAKKGEKGVIQIIIDEKGEKKTKELTAPYVLTIKETPEKTIVVSSPHLELTKGEELTWTIKSDELHMSKDVKVIELDKDAVIHVKKHGEEGDEVIELTAKAIKLDKFVHAPKHVNVQIVTKDGDTQKVIVSPNVKVHTDVQLHPNFEVHADADAHATVAVAVQSEISKKQLEKIRESIRKLKEQDLDASEKEEELERIEKVIAQMNKRLEERHSHDYAYTYRLHTEPLHIEMIHKGEGEEKKDVYFVGKEENYAVGLVNDEGTFTLFIHGDHNEASKEDYEKVVQRLKERLPEGYEVWTEFDEEKDRFSIKIKGGEDMDVSSEVFKELMTALKEELHKIKK
jgi:beta-lactamase regulating signal transducer with metallopeptidase domain/lipopolysaccharide export system protein LptC